MSSGMRLRSTIRAPVRYGEGESSDETASVLQSMRSARGQASTEDEPAEGNNNDRNVRRREQVRPRIMEYDPNLPPAPFPTLDHPRPRGENVSEQSGQPGRLHNVNANGGSQNVTTQSITDSGQYFENYLASNNDQNQTYTTNMQIMANACFDVDPNTDSAYATSDSEGEEGGLSSKRLRRLLAKTRSNPTWNDVAPSLQLEIITNLLEDETENWVRACSRLGLTLKESQALVSLIEKHNEAIKRENVLLEEMREKQLEAIMNIDHSTIKKSKVPPQLVLHRLAKDQEACISIAQSTSRQLAKINTDLSHAKASEVLTARQYLGRRGLRRNLAGEWGNGLVTMIEPQEETIEPESFKWKKDLTLSLKRGRDDTVHSRVGQTMTTNLLWRLINAFTADTLVNPSNLIRDRMMHDPVSDFEGQVPWWHRREATKVQTISDRQALLQWKLDQAQREYEERKRFHAEAAQSAQAAPAQIQPAVQPQGTNSDYDWNDAELFRYIDFNGELVLTGVDTTDTGLEMFKGVL